jgi:hypothetical protein
MCFAQLFYGAERCWRSRLVGRGKYPSRSPGYQRLIWKASPTQPSIQAGNRESPIRDRQQQTEPSKVRQRFQHIVISRNNRCRPTLLLFDPPS